MNKMNGKLLIVISLILLIPASFNLFSAPEDPEKKGLIEFVNYLNSQKEMLGYKNFGLLEHADRVEVRIHCDEETLGKIMAGSSEFNYKKITVVRSAADTVTVVVIFYKPGAQPPEEPKPVEPKPVEPEVTPIEKPVEEKMPPEQVEEPKPQKCPRRVKVQVRDITPQTFNEYKYFKGPIAPAKEIEALSPSDEEIAEILVKMGDEVTKGQLLIRFDAERLNNDIKQAESDLKRWKRELFRRENWKVRSTGAENQAKRNIKRAETTITEYKELLNNVELKSPGDGKVIFVVDKTVVPKGQLAVKLINPSIMKLDLPTEDQHLFEDGQRIILSFKDSGIAYVGRVEKKDNSLKIMIENDALKLSEGLLASFRILLEKHENAVVLDPNILLEDDTGKFLYVVNGKFAKKAYLTLGPIEEGKILVRSGLSLEDKIISTGIPCLEEGKKIKVVEPKPEGKPKPEVKPEPEKFVKPEKKPEKIAEEEITDKNMLKLSFGLNYNMVGDDVFKEVYGSSLMGGYFGLAYSFSPSFEIFGAASYMTKKGTFTEFDDEVTLTMFPVLYVGGKFKFKTPGKFRPYLGAAVTIYNLKEKTVDIETDPQSGTGFSLLGGAVMNLSPKLGLFFDLKYDLMKITIEEADSDLDLSGLRLTFGLTYKFKLL